MLKRYNEALPVKSGTGGIVVISETVCCRDLGWPAKLPPKAEASPAAIPRPADHMPELHRLYIDLRAGTLTTLHCVLLRAMDIANFAAHRFARKRLNTVAQPSARQQAKFERRQNGARSDYWAMLPVRPKHITADKRAAVRIMMPTSRPAAAHVCIWL